VYNDGFQFGVSAAFGILYTIFGIVIIGALISAVANINAISGLIGTLIGAGAALISAYLANRHNRDLERLRFKNSEFQRRKELIGQLSGQKILSQNFFSSYEAHVYSDFHFNKRRIFKNLGKSEDILNLELEEQKYWIRRGNELKRDLLKEKEHLFELIGLISVSFVEADELIKLISRIYDIKTPIPPKAPETWDLSELNIWKENAIQNLDILVKEQYDEPIDDLLNHLRKAIHDEENKA
jgi:hypothetical protein